MILIRRAVVGLAGALAMAAAIGWLVLRSSLPETNGTLRLSGLTAAVEITRDAHGVPTIRAADEADAYFGLGFVHAQDRLWQMESIRLLGTGRLAEVIGPEGLTSDRYIRTLGLHRLVREQVAHLRPETTAVLEAYAAGVNAWITAHRNSPLPPEFLALRHHPEPWTPADSLLWGRLMAMQLSGNWRDEMLRTRLARTLPDSRIAELWPPPPSGHPTTLAEAQAAISPEAALSLLAAVPESLRPTLASNEWVVSGRRTVTGRPYLANDPHLAFNVPILWYLARIEAPNLTLAGATVPGVPFHVLGHNGRIAWGLTTTHSDTQDVFIERLSSDGASYDTPKGPQPFTVRHETILVRDAAPVDLMVRETRHGPVISGLGKPMPEAEPEPGHVLALAAAALAPDDTTPEAFHRLARSQDWTSFRETLHGFRSPQLNVVYADTGGTIAFIAPGRVPIRAAGDGSAPVPGWTGAHDWIGSVPFDRLPMAVDPPSGMLVNANNRITPDGYPYLLASWWHDGYRASRIQQLLGRRTDLSMPDMLTIQSDTRSNMVDDLLPLMLKVTPADDTGRKALAMLEAWNRHMDRGRPEPLIFTAWILALKQAVFRDDLGSTFDHWRGERPLVLKHALTDGQDWCDDTDTAVVETCAEMLERSLARALADLTTRHGARLETWRWGAAHRATFDHALFSHIPVLDRLAGLSIPSDGGDFTVNRGTVTGKAPGSFSHGHGPGLRAVYDLSDLNRSEFIIATGQSGNLFSPHYDDLLKIWRNGGSFRLDGPIRHRLTLVPPHWSVTSRPQAR
ncbi:MAG: penicillin acylase family protein [Alphaproteobacteria bacterium]